MIQGKSVGVMYLSVFVGLDQQYLFTLELVCTM